MGVMLRLMTNANATDAWLSLQLSETSDHPANTNPIEARTASTVR